MHARSCPLSLATFQMPLTRPTAASGLVATLLLRNRHTSTHLDNSITHSIHTHSIHTRPAFCFHSHRRRSWAALLPYCTRWPPQLSTSVRTTCHVHSHSMQGTPRADSGLALLARPNLFLASKRQWPVSRESLAMHLPTALHTCAACCT